MRLLLVEDDELITALLVKALAAQNYVIDVAADGQAGWDLVAAYSYDLILLDVLLPKLDGISFCRRLRSQGLQTPVLLLTAQDTRTNKVMGLDAGADDFVAKPFDLQELLARMRALLRRGTSPLPPQLEWGDLCLDPSTCQVTYKEQPLHLSPKEYSMLELFLRNPQRVFSCGVILDQLWSFEEVPGEDTVRAHIKGLRQKLKGGGMTQEVIETVYGIGYRLKPMEELPHPPDPLGKEASKDTLADAAQVLPAAIAGVWERTQAKLLQRLAVLEQALLMEQRTPLSQELRQQALQAAHKLSGSLGMFGFVEGSRLAQAIEQRLQTGRSLGLEQPPLLKLLSALQRELQQATADSVSPELSIAQPLTLLIISPNQPWGEALGREALARELQAALVPDPITARQWLTRRRVHALLLDLANSEPEAGLQLMADLRSRTLPLPVFVNTRQDQLVDRVEIARLGGQGFFQASATAAEILEAVNQALQRWQPPRTRVLAVDDDPEILVALHRLLEPWGIQLTTLDEPLRFWEVLEAVAPELLILDVAMPAVNGVELCQVVRNDPHWSSLPVLFLTARTDAETMHRVFTAGADDFVCKPIVGPELVTRLLNRLERSRLLRGQAEIDGLTHLPNRRQATQALTRLLGLAERHHQPLCFVLLALEGLQAINDQYGYGVGDRALRHFGKLLQQTFQSEDVVARWGGDKFVVGMYGMSRSDGMRRLTSLWQALHQDPWSPPEGPQQLLRVALGMAQYPGHGTEVAGLYQAARTRLQNTQALDDNKPIASCA